MRAAGRAADLGYGFLTIVEVTTDLSRDTGLLLQGKHHYSRFGRDQRGKLVMARLTGAVLFLVSSLWLAVGFAVAVALAARGVIEPLRRFRVEVDPSISPVQAGLALNNLAFVGLVPDAEQLELAPTRPYADHWFPNPGIFPNIFQEDVARDRMLRTDSGFNSEELAALRQAATHPGQRELEILARAQEADLVSTRWQVPFPDTLSMFTMPLPHFTEIRYAALANVSRAAVEVMDGNPAQAEQTLHQLISAETPWRGYTRSAAVPRT